MRPDWPQPDEILIDYPDPAPGFYPPPRPGAGFRLASPWIALALIVASVTGVVLFSKADIRPAAFACLAVGGGAIIWLPFTISGLKRAKAWREGRIVPARVLNPLLVDADFAGLTASVLGPGAGMMARAAGGGGGGMVARVEYVANAMVHIAEVGSEGDVANRQVNQVVWILLHRQVWDLNACAPRSQRMPVSDNLRRSLLHTVNQLPRA